MFEEHIYVLTVTVSRDNKQIKLYTTYSRAHALWGLVPVPRSYFKPFSVLTSIRRSSRLGNVHKSPCPSSLGHSSRQLPLFCRKAKSSPYFHLSVSLAVREAVSVRIWYNLLNSHCYFFMKTNLRIIKTYQNS